MTREEREKRRALDQGDPEATVYMLRSSNNDADAYHEELDCRQISHYTGKQRAERPGAEGKERVIEEVTRRAAKERHWRTPCTVCVLD